ncbi:4-hydroxy-3-methylbut-2-enyl diphosphate reductase [Longispora albida]|uniref:4-hydroxy-3-methylbut-2-enyl diphosphate reductase n=1 Tax=Longispora albida TaxID=203523 RepID=UPI00039E1CF6|nr:4-hydroxy-3-methylbut-2-enyl diphosphate reductase [Longispora albida]
MSKPKKVLLAAPRGFCAGVDRAIGTVEAALARYGPPVYVRKQIVHNTHVVADLSARGAVFVEELDAVPEGAIVVYSAHGVSPAVRTEAAGRGLNTIDATCPLVAKVHAEVRRYTKEGFQVLLIGHAGHEEVEGVLGEAPDAVRLVDEHTDLASLPIGGDEQLVWLSQTTLAVDDVAETAARLRARAPHLADPPSDDICYASQNRQRAVKLIAPDCDLLLVIGSPNSSNSVRLVEVAQAAGARQAYLIDAAADIVPGWLDGVDTVGVSSGASAPEVLVTDVLAWLASQGFTTVEPVSSGEEDLVFTLPPMH